MKTLISTFAMSVALCCAATFPAQGRNWNAEPRPVCDSVLLSQRTDGDCIVQTYRIRRDKDCNNDFSVRYRINLSTLSPSSDGNVGELAALNAFMDSLSRDSLMFVRSVTITGYASPDGVETSNRRLAHARAMDFKNYLDRKYGLSNLYNVKVEAVVDSWDSCLDGLNGSKVEGREQAAAVIRSRDAMAEKERRLKSMPQVWNYLAANVLPPLRQADIEFDYGRDDISEVRVLTRPAAPRPKPQPVEHRHENRCCCCGADIYENVTVVEDLTNGLIVEMGEVDVDY